MTNQKQFTATWGEGYVKEESRAVDFAFFSDGNGYSEQDRQAIARLAIGETWRSDEPNTHYVQRIG